MSTALSTTVLGLVKTQADADALLALAQTPDGKFVLEALHEKVLSRVDDLLDGFISITIKETPGLTKDDVVNIVDGDIWHYERRKLGLFGAVVDVLRAIPEFAGLVKALIEARYDSDEAPTEKNDGPAAVDPKPEAASAPEAAPEVDLEDHAVAVAESEGMPPLALREPQELTAVYAPVEGAGKPGFLQAAEEKVESFLHLSEHKD